MKRVQNRSQLLQEGTPLFDETTAKRLFQGHTEPGAARGVRRNRRPSQTKVVSAARREMAEETD